MSRCPATQKFAGEFSSILLISSISLIDPLSGLLSKSANQALNISQTPLRWLAITQVRIALAKARFVKHK